MKGKTSVVKICKNFWKEILVFEYCRKVIHFVSIINPLTL